MKVDKNTLGKRIKDIRVNKCSNTMEEFGNKVGSGKSNVSRWERGENIPNSITLKKIAELGNITVDELLYGSFKNVVRELIEEAKYFANNGEFNELELDPKGLKDTLREISSYYWRYYIKVANESKEEKARQEEIESLFSTISKKCKNQGINMTDYKKIFQCIHSFFTDTIFLDSYSNIGFIDYTIDHLMNVTNEKLPNYIELANKQNMSIDSDLYASTVEALSETMNKIDKSKKEYPNE